MLSWLVREALFVVRISWIQALLPYGAALFIHPEESWPYCQFEMDSIETQQHEMPTYHTSTIPSVLLNISAQDDYSPALSMFAANDEWLGSGMPSSIFGLESSASSSVQPVKAIHPMYLETQHPSQGSSGMTTSIPNLDKELKNYNSELKRKIFDESGDSLSKKLKQPVDMIDVNHRKSNPLTVKPNTRYKDQGLIQQIQRFAKLPVYKGDNQMRSILAHPLRIYQYAFVSTLNFPRFPQSSKIHSFHGKVLAKSDLWNSLHGEGPRLPPLIESFTSLSHDTKSKSTIISRASSLLEEIFLRDTQFLIALTSPNRSAHQSSLSQFEISTEELNQFRLREQENLLRWLVKLFHTRIESHDPEILLKSGVLNEEAYSISSLVEMLSHYLRVNLETQEEIFGYWIEKPNRNRKSSEKKVSYASAIKTKVAINTLGNYYKSTNPKKWRILFRCDWHFVNIFARIKKNQRNRTLNCLYKRHFQELEASKLFPWRSSETPLNVKPMDKRRSIQNFDWYRIQTYFKYIENNTKYEENTAKI